MRHGCLCLLEVEHRPTVVRWYILGCVYCRAAVVDETRNVATELVQCIIFVEFASVRVVHVGEKGLNLIRLPLLPIHPFFPLALLTLLQQEGEKDAYRTVTPFHLGDVREEREVGTKAHRIASDQRPPCRIRNATLALEANVRLRFLLAPNPNTHALPSSGIQWHTIGIERKRKEWLTFAPTEKGN